MGERSHDWDVGRGRGLFGLPYADGSFHYIKGLHVTLWRRATATSGQTHIMWSNVSEEWILYVMDPALLNKCANF